MIAGSRDPAISPTLSPVQPFRAAKALPAAGAYDPEPELVPVPSKATGRLTLLCLYALSTDPSATGAGQARLRPEWRVGGQWVPDPAVLYTPAPATFSGYQRAALGPSELTLPAGAVRARSIVPFTVHDGADAFRCAAAEVGESAYPGSLALSAAWGSR